MSQSSGDPVMYGLYAVLVHSGYSCHAGHYYCYVKVSRVALEAVEVKHFRGFSQIRDTLRSHCKKVGKRWIEMLPEGQNIMDQPSSGRGRRDTFRSFNQHQLPRINCFFFSGSGLSYDLESAHNKCLPLLNYKIIHNSFQASNGQWYQMNDSLVHSSNIKVVLNQQAYVLFYLR